MNKGIRMKKLLIVVLLLTGCNREIYPSDHKKATETCKNNEGYKQLNVTKHILTIECNNGGLFRIARFKDSK